MKQLALLLLLTLSAHGVTLTWDDDNNAGEVTKYTIYQKVVTTTGTVSWVKLKDVAYPTKTASLVITKRTTVTVTATGTSGIESLRSEEFVFVQPLAPRNLR